MGGGLAEVGICGSRGERRTLHGHDLTREPRPGRPGSWLLVSPRGGRGSEPAASLSRCGVCRRRSPAAGGGTPATGRHSGRWPCVLRPPQAAPLAAEPQVVAVCRGRRQPRQTLWMEGVLMAVPPLPRACTLAPPRPRPLQPQPGLRQLHLSGRRSKAAPAVPR